MADTDSGGCKHGGGWVVEICTMRLGWLLLGLSRVFGECVLAYYMTGVCFGRIELVLLLIM